MSDSHQAVRRIREERATWDVDSALEEVAQALRDGARPLGVSAEVTAELKDWLRGSFQEQRDAGKDWAPARNQVLRVAFEYGRKAMLFTLAAAVKNPQNGPPAEIDPELTQFAGTVAALLDCPRDFRPEGSFCPPVSEARTESVDAIWEVLSRIEPN